MIMIGDTVYDVEGAKELQIPCIGVTWGYGIANDMVKAGAIGLADSAEQLYQMIHQF
jgi:phosphoglycolate phosphatase